MKFDMNSTVEIDRKNIGITSTIKNYVSMMYDKALIALNVGWNSRSDTEEGYFNFYVPLNMLLDFCEDYKRVLATNWFWYQRATITIAWREILWA